MEIDALRRVLLDRAEATGRLPHAREILGRLVRPRLSGSTGWAETRRILCERFADLGYESHLKPFSISPSPGRFVLPAIGLALLLSSAFGRVSLEVGNRGAAVAGLVLGGLLVWMLAAGTARATDRWRIRRMDLANLWFQVPDVRPRWLLVAHFDSKSQFVPLALRAFAVASAGAGWGGLLILALLGGRVAQASMLLDVLGVIVTLAGAALLLSGAGNRSPGALDNASGVATLLGVAARERDSRDIAFLATDAEELGLAGARAIARELEPLEGVINIDGIDDAGPFHILEGFGLQRGGYSPHLAMALLLAARALGVSARRRDVPPGLLVDHMAFLRAGFPALTLMRGTLRSMTRVHRPHDDLHHLRGDGIGEAVSLVCAALHVLRTEDGRRELPA
jgi:hypothetical protein